ncbi:MAG: KH domain-containing protein [Ruminococcus sp.]|nr:KH domain-containing protein [Candidatus Copronaster equi]
MIKEAFGKGDSTEAAIAAAKAQLDAPWDADVKVEVIKAFKKKTLGLFGGSQAEVRAYYEIPDEKPKAVKKPVQKAEKQVKKVDSAEKKVVKEEVKKEIKKEVKQEVKVEAPVKNIKSDSDSSECAKKYIESVLKDMGVAEFEISAEENDEGIFVQVNCESDYGYIIGRRGETLDAIQYLACLVVNKGKDDYKRVTINAGNYREKREETLRALAKKNAARVKKYGRNVCLDPMNPYERRIIHTTVQEIEGVDSHSVGSESERKVVITLAEGFEATNPSNGRGRRNNSNRRVNKTNDAQPTRAPRSDSAGTSLYGKIEPKNNSEE